MTPPKEKGTLVSYLAENLSIRWQDFGEAISHGVTAIARYFF